MQPDPRAYLWDARQAAERVVEFIAGRTWQKYEADAFLHSAVERQFEIVGEALNKLRHADPTLAAEIADLPRIVAFGMCSSTVTPPSTTGSSGRSRRSG